MKPPAIDADWGWRPGGEGGRGGKRRAVTLGASESSGDSERRAIAFGGFHRGDRGGRREERRDGGRETDREGPLEQSGLDNDNGGGEPLPFID